MHIGLIRRLANVAILVLAFVATALTAAPASASRGASMGTDCLPSSLRSTLQKVRAKFGPIVILSTHRPGARIAGSGRQSLHASCRAVDFKPTRNHASVVAWLKANHSGGVGTYSGSMSHIHIDNGAHVRFHRGGGRSYASKRTTRSRA